MSNKKHSWSKCTSIWYNIKKGPKNLHWVQECRLPFSIALSLRSLSPPPKSFAYQDIHNKKSTVHRQLISFINQKRLGS